MCNFSFSKNVRVSGKTSTRVNGVAMYSDSSDSRDVELFELDFMFGCWQSQEYWNKWQEYMRFLNQYPDSQISYSHYLECLDEWGEYDYHLDKD